MKTSKEMMGGNPTLWIKFSELADIITTNGIYDTPEFGRGHREFLFAYISKRNNCKYCSTRHFDFAASLGVTELPIEVLELVDLLYNNILSPVSQEITPLIEQIIATISLANFINTHMIAYNVPIGPIALEDTPFFKESGYQVAFSNLLNR